MNVREAWQRLSLIGFALAGLGSAWLTVWVRAEVLAHGRVTGFWFLLWQWNGWGSLTFGLFLAACLWLFLGLRSIWRTLLLFVASPAVALLSFYTAFFMAIKFRI